MKAKKQKYTKVNIRLTDEEHSFIKELSRLTDLSFSKVVTFILALYLMQEKGK